MHLQRAGYTRIWLDGELRPLDPTPELPPGAPQVLVVVDRFTWQPDQGERLAQAAEQAFRRGEGRLELVRGGRPAERRSERYECSSCGAPAARPEPALFSFNSPLGVCQSCRGFGNVLTFMPELIVPDPDKTLGQDAVRPWAGSWRKVFRPRLEKLAKERGIPMNVPWKKLAAEHRDLIMEGGPGFRGALPFLERLKRKAYDVGNRFVVKKYQVPL